LTSSQDTFLRTSWGEAEHPSKEAIRVSQLKELDELRLILEGMRLMGMRRDSIARQIGVPLGELDAFANNKITSVYTIDNLRKWISPLSKGVFNSRLGRFLTTLGIVSDKERRRFLLNLAYQKPSSLIKDKLYEMARAVFSRRWYRNTLSIQEVFWIYERDLKPTKYQPPRKDRNEDERPKSNKYATLFK